MTLLDIVEQLGKSAEWDEDDAIYAVKPWTPTSEAMIIRGPLALRDVSVEAEKLGMTYFLEVFIAKEVLDDWFSLHRENHNKPSPLEKCLRLVTYARDDA